MGHNPDTVPVSPGGLQRVAVLDAGGRGDEASLAVVDRALLDDDPGLRATALGAMAEQGRLDASILEAALGDPTASVRIRAAQLASQVEPEPLASVAALVAIGDLGAVGASEAVAEMARSSNEPLVVEEAVATIGALGAEAGLELILDLLECAKPALRRRCVAALGAFEGDEVEAALDRLAEDRDWQVRQAVAMLRREG